MNILKGKSTVSMQNGLIAVFLFLTLIAINVSGCATQREVKELVETSNKDLLMSIEFASLNTAIEGNGADSMSVQHSGLGEKSKVDQQEQWKVLSGKIDAFITAHPDQKVTASALRMRQAMLLLAHKQYALAKAAFKMVEQPELLNTRDKALYTLRTHLIWWFKVSDSEILSLKELGRADEALEAIQKEIPSLNESPGIRDYLAEIRVWIALVSARSITNKDKAGEYLEDGINKYSKIFTNDDLAELKKNSAPTDWDASMETVRRRLRVKAVIDYAKTVIIRQRIEPVPEFEPDVFKDLIG